MCALVGVGRLVERLLRRGLRLEHLSTTTSSSSSSSSCWIGNVCGILTGMRTGSITVLSAAFSSLNWGWMGAYDLALFPLLVRRLLRTMTTSSSSSKHCICGLVCLTSAML